MLINPVLPTRLVSPRYFFSHQPAQQVTDIKKGLPSSNLINSIYRTPCPVTQISHLHALFRQFQLAFRFFNFKLHVYIYVLNKSMTAINSYLSINIEFEM